MFFQKLYGASSRLRLLRKNGVIVFKSRPSTNFIIFLITAVSLTLGLLILSEGIAIDFLMSFPAVCAVLILSLLLAVSYRKSFVFSSEKERLAILKSILWIRGTTEVPFGNVEAVELSTKKSVLAGAAIPLRVPKHSVKVILTGGKPILIDCSSDGLLMQEYAKAISGITAKELRKGDFLFSPSRGSRHKG